MKYIFIWYKIDDEDFFVTPFSARTHENAIKKILLNIIENVPFERFSNNQFEKMIKKIFDIKNIQAMKLNRLIYIAKEIFEDVNLVGNGNGALYRFKDFSFKKII